MAILYSPTLMLLSIAHSIIYLEILNLIYQSRYISDKLRVHTGRAPNSAIVAVVIVTLEVFPYLVISDHCILTAAKYALIHSAIMAHRDLQVWADVFPLLAEYIYVFLFTLGVLLGQSNSLHLVRYLNQ